MRKLFFTTGSPFSRAVRIMLVEKGLEFEREETFTTPTVEERARSTPTLQVPTLIDGDLKLWDSAVIIEYLMSSYPSAAPPAGQQPLAADFVRSTHTWEDRLVHATLQTLGTSTTTISQMQWSGISHEDNSHGTRCAIRNQHLFEWFEARLSDSQNGFVHGEVSAQDIFLACWCQFIERRPLRLTWAAPDRPKITALVARLAARPSFEQEPILWWEPGVTYASAAEIAWAAEKTVQQGLAFAEWRSA